MTDQTEPSENEPAERHAEAIEREMNRAAPSEVVVNLRRPHVVQRSEADKRDPPLTIPSPQQDRSNG